MMFVLTARNACRSGLFDILSVVWVGRTYMIWPPYKDRCALLHLDTLTKRRSIACVRFIFDVLSGRVNSPSLLSVLALITPRYPTRGTELLRIDVHRTNHGTREPMSSAMRQFNEVIGLFDFGLTWDQFLHRLKLNLYKHISNSSTIFREHCALSFQRSICFRHL
jgi:hypothetical protein